MVLFVELLNQSQLVIGFILLILTYILFGLIALQFILFKAGDLLRNSEMNAFVLLVIEE